MAFELDNMTEKQQRIAADFLERVLTGQSVTFMDFPGVTQEEFEEVADALALMLGPTEGGAQ